MKIFSKVIKSKYLFFALLGWAKIVTGASAITMHSLPLAILTALFVVILLVSICLEDKIWPVNPEPKDKENVTI